MAQHATEQATVGLKTSAHISPRTRINVRLAENVNLETLQSVVARIVGHTGCTACGLLGVDLTLGGDPAEVKQVEQLPGVRSVSFS